MEWLLEDEDGVVVTGLLLREFGRGADIPAPYGDAAARVARGVYGPEYEWTRLRVEDFMQQELSIAARAAAPGVQPAESIKVGEDPTTLGERRQDSLGAIAGRR